MKFLKYTQLAALILLPFFIQAQPGRREGMPKVCSVKGKVLDANSKSVVEYATIGLFRTRDSSLVTGTVSNGKGFFLIEGLPYGRFYLTVEFIGYQKKFTKAFGLNPRYKGMSETMMHAFVQ